MTTPAHNALVAERLENLCALPTVKNGPAWMARLAGELAAMVDYPLQKAQRLLGTIASTHGIATADEARAARSAELRGIAANVTASRSGALRIAASPVSTGNVERDARLLELHAAAKSASRR